MERMIVLEINNDHNLPPNSLQDNQAVRFLYRENQFANDLRQGRTMMKSVFEVAMAAL